MSSYDVRARSAAAPAVVFGVLADVASWPSWQQISKIRAEGETWVVGDRPRTVVQVTDSVPDRSLTYVEISETLWRGYRSTIDLTRSVDGGTDIRWHCTFRSRPPFLDGFWRWYLQKEMQKNVDALARKAAAGR
ncbi:SRPBCC family protein [Catenuloplanes japonicus]|uniref:SRPBCC family protein n=1 Tax=Catenuloplanes japonicus TaxID=33876 RepID=UPI000A538613|nr:SRPBCC family protein [Catenuloplanes japonicus]